MDSDLEPSEEIKQSIFAMKSYQQKALIEESIPTSPEELPSEKVLPSDQHQTRDSEKVLPSDQHQTRDSETSPQEPSNTSNTEPEESPQKPNVSAPNNSKLIKSVYKGFDVGLNKIFNFILKNDKEESQDFFQRDEEDYDYITSETQAYLDYLNIKLDDNPHLRFIIAIGSSYAVPLMLFYFAGGFSEFGKRIRRKKTDE